MHAFTWSPQPPRRPRRRPTLATLVRVLGSVQVSDHPIAWSPPGSSPSFSGASPFLTGRRAPGGPLQLG